MGECAKSCVSATGPIGLPVFFCLNSCCNHMTEVKKVARFVRLALMGVKQNVGGRV